MTQPRLFADLAAAPTPAERRAARAHNTAGQGSLFDAGPIEPGRCPVCAGDHDAPSCPHGTAPDLFTDDRPERCTEPLT